MLKNAIVSFIISLAVVAGGLYYYHKHYEPKIVAVNFNNFLKSQEKQFILGKITKKQLEYNLKRGLLVIKNQPRNAVVLSGKCLLRGHAINIK